MKTQIKEKQDEILEHLDTIEQMIASNVNKVKKQNLELQSKIASAKELQQNTLLGIEKVINLLKTLE